ncbi:MAG TPA: M1 family metallopeptidase [Microlunatus sp.]
MWSADSSGAPGWPPPPEHRPHPLSYVLAVLLPLVLVAIMAVPVAVWGLARLRESAAGTGARGSGAAAADEGGAGVGDPYFPDYGSSGYDAISYEIAVDWDPEAASLTGRTKITARASQPLRSFYVDLALDANSAQVNGSPATSTKEGFQDLKITPTEPIETGAEFEVIIDYAGRPGQLLRDGKTPWLTTDDEWTAAGEPASSAWWFPANDHPSDPALMDVSVRVPAGLEAISVGRLESRDRAGEADFDTWHWVAQQPMASYLNFVSIGQYELEEGVIDGRPYVYAVTEQLDEDDRRAVFTVLRGSGEVVRGLERLFGPYPFTEIGGVVPAHAFDFAGLETQTRPIYDPASIRNPGFAQDLLVHELAHMWFGDQVTLKQWNDIFINEGYAAWAQWGYAEGMPGRRSGNQRLNEFYDRLADQDKFWRVTMIDPGPDQLFSTVYTRGPMVLQALRNIIGNDAFLALAREWSAVPRPRSVEDWMIQAQAKTKVDLAPFFQAWIFSPEVPARTAENGFRP